MAMTKPKAPKKKRVKPGTSREAAEQKRLVFVETYLANGGNASNAALVAGYSPKTVGVTGAKMLKDPRIKLLVQQRQAEIVKDLSLTTDRVLLETKRMAFSDVRGLYHPDGRIKLPTELDDDTAAAVSGFKIDEYGRIEYKMHDKNSPNERLFKHIGLYKADNDQKGDVVASLLAQVAGTGFKPVK